MFNIDKLNIDSPIVNSVVYRAVEHNWATSITEQDYKSLRWLDLVYGNIYENQTQLMKQSIVDKVARLPEIQANYSEMCYDVHVQFIIFLWAALYRREQKQRSFVSDDEFLFLFLKK